MGYHEYFEYSVKITELTPDEKAWFEKLFSYQLTEDDWPLDEYASDESDDPNYTEYVNFINHLYSPEDESFPAFDHFFKKSKSAGTCVTLHGGEVAHDEGPVQLSKVLNAFLSKFRPTEKISFRWVRWDNRGNNTYDGGAYVISADKIEEIHLSKWLESKLKE